VLFVGHRRSWRPLCLLLEQEEISATLQSQHMKELIRSIQPSAVVESNDAYFFPRAAEPAFPPTTSRTGSDTEEPVHAPACRPQ
jgi:hypothetical protein